MKLFIKSMVSKRCQMIVEAELNSLGINFNSVGLGVVDTVEDVSDVLKDQLRGNLRAVGLDVIVDKKLILIEKIKTIIIETIHYSDEVIRTNFSEYI